MIVKKIEEKGEPSMWETGTWVCTLPRTQNNSFSPPKELNSYAIKKKKKWPHRNKSQNHGQLRMSMNGKTPGLPVRPITKNTANETATEKVCVKATVWQSN